MNSLLISSQKSPLHLARSNSPWKPIMAPPLLPSNIQNPIINPSTTWKLLLANAKGFGASIPAASNIEEERSINKKKNNNNNEENEIPMAVLQRIIVRILISVGAPMALGIALLHLFGIVKEQHIWDVPMWIPFMSVFLTFGASVLGIPYGALSASLDPNKQGSLFGFEEAQQNWVEMWKEDENKN